MRYSFRKALRMIFLNRILYIIIACEVGFGMFLFSVGLQVQLSANDMLERMSAGAAADTVQLTYYNAYTATVNGPVVPRELWTAYCARDGVAESMEKLYAPYIKSNIFFWDAEGGQREIYLLFIDEEGYRFLGGQKEIGNGLVGSGAAESLRLYEEKMALDESSATWFSEMELSEGRLTLYEIWECDTNSLHAMDTQLEQKLLNEPLPYMTEEEQFLLKDCILLPMEELDEVEKAELGIDVILQISFKEGKENWKLVAELIKELAEGKELFSFSLSQQTMVAESNTSDILIPYQTKLYMGLAVLVATISGMIGVFLLQLHKREKTNAVTVACGATYARLFAELCIEVFLVLFVGMATGIYVSAGVVKQTYINAVNLSATVHAEGILLCLLIPVLATLLICGSTIWFIRRRPVSEVMKLA